MEILLFFPTALKWALLFAVLVVEAETTLYLWVDSICLLYSAGKSIHKSGSFLLLLPLIPRDILFTTSEHDAERNRLVWTLGMNAVKMLLKWGSHIKLGWKRKRGSYDQQLQIHGVFHFVNKIPTILELEREKEEKVKWFYSHRWEIKAKS